MAEAPVDGDGRSGLRDLFSFLFPRRPEPPTVQAIAPKVTDDGAVIVTAGGTTQGVYVDLDASIKTEADLIGRYREIAQQPEVDRAINEIVNDAIVQEDNEDTVEILLDDLMVEDRTKLAIQAEFKNILNILDFDFNAYEIFKTWYIEGRLYYQVVVDSKRLKDGIVELRWIDPRRIRKVREVDKIKDPRTGAVIQKTRNEYYIYSEQGTNYGSRLMVQMATQGLRISKDAIIHVPSGLTDTSKTMGISYLHTAIKAMNQLRQLEDSTMIYYFSRAPEKRIFYIETGGMPRGQAETHVESIMRKHRNKLSYNAMTGEMIDARRQMTFIEDYWFPRRGDGKGTEVVPLSGGTQLPDLIQAVEYFQDKLYRALQVPVTRLKPDTLTTLGRATEVTRDEINFGKFIGRLRQKFSQLFLRALERQLILKGIVAPDDWDVMRKYIKFRFQKDQVHTEIMERQIFLDRLEAVQMADIYAGKYFSHTWIRKHILKQSDEDIMEQDEQIAMDLQNPLYNLPLFEPMPEDGKPGGNGPPPKSKPAKK